MTDEIIKKMACEAIRNYLRVKPYFDEFYDEVYSDEWIEKNYSLALNLAIENYKNVTSKTNGLDISSISQGGQSISFNNTSNNNFISNDVKALLPRAKNVWSW